VPLDCVYRGRRAASIENDCLRVTVLAEGGHIAEVLDKTSGVNPLWTPPWPSIEPSAYDPAVHREYGNGAEARLLAGIMGHNVCLDIFGGPSPEEASAGMTAHGDAPVSPYEIAEYDRGLLMRTHLPLASIRFERSIALRGPVVAVHERLESLCAFDRPIAWTQHVTLGPPFLERGATEFRISAARSQVFDGQFGAADYLRSGACFDWPHAPRAEGGVADLQVLTGADRSSAYTAHLMDRSADTASFVAFSPAVRLAFGYLWRRSDFPWMGIWEENASRTGPPWSGRTLARGLEFGVSPFAETRRAMVDRGRLFDTPTYRWLPARASLEATYRIVVEHVASIHDVSMSRRDGVA
jgi:hypothetical protein